MVARPDGCQFLLVALEAPHLPSHLLEHRRSGHGHRARDDTARVTAPAPTVVSPLAAFLFVATLRPDGLPLASLRGLQGLLHPQDRAAPDPPPEGVGRRGLLGREIGLDRVLPNPANVLPSGLVGVAL